MSKHMFSIGASYNPCHIQESVAESISLPEDVILIELGLSELEKWSSSHLANKINLSLHLARTPITEDFENQKEFINFIAPFVERSSSLISIGLHLTDPRHEGIGKYGFSSHYRPTKIKEQCAIDFIKMLGERFQLPIWIENANFYSESPREVLNSWESIHRICAATEALVIADLSHILIDGRNVELNPEILLGMVPWSKVIEYHLSGIVQGDDHTLHDGHSKPVYSEVWQLFALCLKNLTPTTILPYAIIEHSDPSWRYHKKEYFEDFDKLRELQACNLRKEFNAFKNAESYAISYLKKIISQSFPRLKDFLEKRSVNFHKIFSDWIKDVTETRNKRIALTWDEIELSEKKHTVCATQDFREFIESYYANRH